MAHQPGWIELYERLESGRAAPPALVAQCKASRTGLGETMLHWYAIEGEPAILEQLIGFGFAVDVQNEFGKTPIMECAMIGRWDNARVLFDHGADLTITTADGDDFFAIVDELVMLGELDAAQRPGWTRRGS